VEISVPSLAEREGDIPLLARFFLQHFAKQYGRHLEGITPKAMLVLKRHHWPGNVRELENVMGHAAIMTPGPRIEVEDLPNYLTKSLEGNTTEEPGTKQPTTKQNAENGQSGTSLDDQEKWLLLNALENCDGNQSQAARSLSISRDKLRYRMKRHGLL
jgi:DNA-binding NtrC family response regulator